MGDRTVTSFCLGNTRRAGWVTWSRGVVALLVVLPSGTLSPGYSRVAGGRAVAFLVACGTSVLPVICH